jgi:hypothetical protein
LKYLCQVFGLVPSTFISLVEIQWCKTSLLWTYFILKFIFCVPCIFLYSIISKANKLHYLKYSKQITKQFISGANSYRFRHQGAVIREFFSNKCLQVQQIIQALFTHVWIVKVGSLKMSKLQITHPHSCIHNNIVINLLYPTVSEQWYFYRMRSFWFTYCWKTVHNTGRITDVNMWERKFCWCSNVDV